MDDKQASEILRKLLEKGILNTEEKNAVKSALGLFSWTSLSKSSLRNRKERINKSTEWT